MNTALPLGSVVKDGDGNLGIVVAVESDRARVCWDGREIVWHPLALICPVAPVAPTIPEILAACETMSGENVLILREGLPRVAIEWTRQTGTGDMCRPWSVGDRPRLLNGRIDPRPTSDNNVAARVVTLTGDDVPADGLVYEAQVDHDEWEPTRHATEAEAMRACDEGLRAVRVALCGPYLIGPELVVTKRGAAKIAAALAGSEVPS